MSKQWAVQRFNEQLKLWEFFTPKAEPLSREDMKKQLERCEKELPHADF